MSPRDIFAMAADNRTPEQTNSQTSMFCSYAAQVFVLVQRAFSGMAAALAALVPCLAERSCGPTSIGRIVSARLVGAHMALVDLALKVARAPKQWREVWDHLVLAALLRNANGQEATLRRWNRREQM